MICNFSLSYKTMVNASAGNAIMPIKLSDDSESDLNDDSGNE